MDAPSGSDNRSVTVIPFRNYNKIRNFGDAFSPRLIEHITGTPAWFSPGAVEHVLPVGSILFAANRNSHIWGSGLIALEKAPPAISPPKVHALRGKLTYQALKELGYSLGDIPLGDPGIFIDEIMPLIPKPSRRYAAAIIPHHASWNHPVFKALRDRDDVVVINMMTDDPSLLADIAQSDVVISQSLHGLIFAESLGKPSTWIADRDDHKWLFKFRDWQSMCSAPQAEPMPLSSGLTDWIGAAAVRESVIDKGALRAAFPGEQVKRRIAGPLISHETCRRAGPAKLHADVFDERQGFWKAANGDPDLSLTARVREVVRAGRGNWAYPTYTAISGPAYSATEEAIAFACTLLDEHTRYSFASIIPDPSIKGGALKADGRARVLGGALIVRPNARFEPAERFLTIFAPIH